MGSHSGFIWKKSEPHKKNVNRGTEFVTGFYLKRGAIRATIAQVAVRLRIEATMIEQPDIEIVDKEYFEIVEVKDFILVLRSKSTGHYWCLLEQMCNGHRTFRISHRHKKTSPYHFQRNKPSVAACCEYIKSHDAYQLEKERRKAELRMLRREEKTKKKAPSTDK